MKGRLGFLFLVAFFVVFGAGKSNYWTSVTTDEYGWTYAVDVYSVSVSSPELVKCKVMAAHSGGSTVVDTWRLDAGKKLLTRSSLGEPETILPGSVAERILLFFRQRGDLPTLAGFSGAPAR